MAGGSGKMLPFETRIVSPSPPLAAPGDTLPFTELSFPDSSWILQHRVPCWQADSRHPVPVE